jgi:osmotically-inducible protein OsmY
MKKSLLSMIAALSLIVSLNACSNWNRMTPKPLDNTAIETEVRKNLTADSISGLHIDVNNGVVTLDGHLSASDKSKAIADAQKVPGVTRVVDRISVP